MLAIDEPDRLREHVEAKDVGYVERLGPVPPDAYYWTQLDLNICPNCGKTRTLTVTEVGASLDEQSRRLQDFHSIVVPDESVSSESDGPS